LDYERLYSPHLGTLDAVFLFDLVERFSKPFKDRDLLARKVGTRTLGKSFAKGVFPSNTLDVFWVSVR